MKELTEQEIHGRPWDGVHGGYFSSAAVVACFIDAVREAIVASRPQVVIDLGGGTGFLLARLREEEMSPRPDLINLDCSPPQLAMAARRGVTCRPGSLTDFRRGDLATEQQRFLFIMRSVLHYFGRAGLPSLLRHLRGQARQGEFFLHQTACFEYQEEADCLNTLYREMGSNKWYPTRDQLRVILERANWQILSEHAAPPLPLTGVDLAKRYDLDAATMNRLCGELASFSTALPHLLQLSSETFRVDLHYRILICRAG